MRHVVRVSVADVERMRIRSQFTLPLAVFWLWHIGVFLLGAFVFWLVLQIPGTQSFFLGWDLPGLKHKIQVLQAAVDSLAQETYLCLSAFRHVQQAVRPKGHGPDSIFHGPVSQPSAAALSRQTPSYLREKAQTRNPQIHRTSSSAVSAAVLSLPEAIPAFVLPVSGLITGEFSLRLRHFGIDIAVREGTPVRAIESGTILFADWTLRTGYTVVIAHPGGWLSVYKHNQRVVVQEGDWVDQGQPIAYAGNTGLYTRGPHLHLEVWYQGLPVPPRLVLPL